MGDSPSRSPHWKGLIAPYLDSYHTIRAGITRHVLTCPTKLGIDAFFTDAALLRVYGSKRAVATNVVRLLFTTNTCVNNTNYDYRKHNVPQYLRYYCL